MSRPLVSASLSASWSAGDAWTEMYAAVWHLVYDLLPQEQWQAKYEHAALPQLALVGCSTLLEIAACKVLEPFALRQAGLSPSDLKRASFHSMIAFLEAVAGVPFDRTSEPNLSIDALRLRRNQTAHKESAIASFQMARSGLFSAAMGSRHFFAHVGVKFPYAASFAEYELRAEPWFADLDLPPVG